MASYLYQTTLTPTIYGSGVEFSLALGAVTIVKMTVSGGFTFPGLIVPSGPVEGMIVTFAILTNGFTTIFAHDSGSATDNTHRFWNQGLAAVSITGTGAVTYRYDATIGAAPLGRWFQISRT
jgi:hypothetical protein